MLSNIVLKPRMARWVDPGPGRLGLRTSPGLSDNSSGSWPGETQSTWNPASYIYIYIAVKQRHFDLLKGQNDEDKRCRIANREKT
jgi:hypothetical protein